MLSASFAEPLGLWAASRMPLRLFGAAAALIVAAAAVSGAPDMAWLPAAALAALLLLFQFRLWDDLADAARDRVSHPERYLPRCASTAVFKAALASSALANLAAVAVIGSPSAVLGLLALDAVFLLWYRLPAQRRNGWPGNFLLLAKYPAFAALLAPPPLDPTPMLLACAGVYAAVCVHEWRTA